MTGLLVVLMVSVDCSPVRGRTEPICVSGVYPHLAMFSDEGEIGVGAVVPWAGRLWYVTYSPHKPLGSGDKLYSLDEELRPTIHPESIGGTPANRLIHRESNQLFLGPYCIDAAGRVRTIPYVQMPGRPTATMRHLTDPANKVYYFGMEGELYEVEVHTLAVRRLWNPHTIPGSHGKGAYTGQGRVVLANNGEWGWLERWRNDPATVGPTGALVEWDGTHRRLVERKQFCEVTGPGGIRGAGDAAEPVWATGWDERSVILKVLAQGRWSTFRLPKASRTYDGGHGWFTEWPRIRALGTDGMLMTMHGMCYDFPPSFMPQQAGGLRPVATYLKIVADFCRWGDRLVFACDDTSVMQNPLAGRSQSNLWFTTKARLREAGPPAGDGGPWLADSVRAGEPSDPFLVAGFDRRGVHLSHEEDAPVTFTLEVDRMGDDRWTPSCREVVPPHGYSWCRLPADLGAEWIRLRVDRDCRSATAFLHLAKSARTTDRDLFAGLANVTGREAWSGGVIRPRGGDYTSLHFLAKRVDEAGKAAAAGYYEIDGDMNLHRVADPKTAAWLQAKAAVAEPDFHVDAASVVITDSRGRRFRLPKTDARYDRPAPTGWLRGIREVATERYLFNCHGLFYELPRDSAGGVTGIRPVCTHGKWITDFCSWRGMLVLAGTKSPAPADGHCFADPATGVALWFGVLDDLWKLGKPVGRGGPWKDTPVQAGVPSDPYLMTGFDRKTLSLSHGAAVPVTFTVEIDFTATSRWCRYGAFTVAPGETAVQRFPEGYLAHWLRVTADRDCTATAWLVYE